MPGELNFMHTSDVEATTPLVNSMENGHTAANGRNNHNQNHVTLEMSELPVQRQTSTHLAEDSFGGLLKSLTESLKSCRKWTRKRTIDALIVASFLLYLVYIGFAINYDPSSVLMSIIDATLFLLFVIHRFMALQDIARLVTKPLVIQARRRCRINPLVRRHFRRVLTAVLYTGLLVFLAVDVRDDPTRLIPLAGLLFFLLVLFITSKSPFKVKWTPVLWGILLQFILGIVILRWKTGYQICKAIGDLVAGFLEFTDYGSKFVFGETTYTLHVVAFKILPVIVYFSSVVSILYYYGIMQFIVKWLAKVFQYTMNTTAIESFSTAAHIFIGAIEASVILKPFYADLSLSELNAIMTGGFATVAGTVIAAYIEFGIPPEHVISASFMSAPAALAVAKLSWPEPEVIADVDREINLDVGKELNLMEAASNGAVIAIKLVAYVVVNLIAFISLLALFNYCLSFMGSRVGHPEVTFEFLCSYVFMPLAVIMGVPWEDCGNVGKLIGKKIFINEFLSFADLGVMIKNGQIQMSLASIFQMLIGGYLSRVDVMNVMQITVSYNQTDGENRSIVIATYILCGFGSVAAVGINLGAFSAAEPRRRQHFAKGIVRAMICGNIACFMTACVAGILFQDSFLLLQSNSTLDANFTSNFTWFNNTMLGDNATLFNNGTMFSDRTWSNNATFIQ